jgi:RHS repeat-associated protein
MIGYGAPFAPSPSDQVYLLNATASVTGQIAAMEYGNKVNSTMAYEDASTPSGSFGIDHLKKKVVISGTSKFSEREFGWDVLGNLESANDPPQGLTASYGYDDLRRITSATIGISGQNSQFSYSYDPLGNLLTKEGVTQDYGKMFLSPSCPSTNGSLPHALTRRTVGNNQDAYCYDDAGRLLRSTDTPNNSIRNLHYFARGKTSRITDRNGESYFAYDGNGVRVWKSEDRNSQTIPFDFFREIPTGFETTYSAAGQFIARRSISANPELFWYSSDHLGSTNVITNQTGSSTSTAHYRPFGDFAQTTNQNTQSGNRQFNSKELDATGLYDYSARLYDPVTGRFTQPDEVEPGPSAQSQNRYAYVMNNPLANIDPEGTTCQSVYGGTPTCKFDEVTPSEYILSNEVYNQVKAAEKNLTRAYNYLASNPYLSHEIIITKNGPDGKPMYGYTDAGYRYDLDTSSAEVRAGEIAKVMETKRIIAAPFDTGQRKNWVAAAESSPESIRVMRPTFVKDELEQMRNFIHESLHFSPTEAALGLDKADWNAWAVPHRLPYDVVGHMMLWDMPEVELKIGEVTLKPRVKPQVKLPREKDRPDYSAPGVKPR